MDDSLKDILDALPAKAPRSRLEPYREFIQELRRRGRTYRDIAGILAEKCQVQVSASGVHDFVRIRSRGKVKSRAGSSADREESKRSSAVQQVENAETATKTNAAADDFRRRNTALQVERAVIHATPTPFQFDPNEPLRLRDLGKKKPGE